MIRLGCSKLGSEAFSPDCARADGDVKATSKAKKIVAAAGGSKVRILRVRRIMEAVFHGIFIINMTVARIATFFAYAPTILAVG